MFGAQTLVRKNSNLPVISLYSGILQTEKFSPKISTYHLAYIPREPGRMVK
jgi:hypothetical protein